MRVFVSSFAISLLAAASLSAGPVTVNFAGLSVSGAGANSVTVPYTQDGFKFNDSDATIVWGSGDVSHPNGGDANTSLVPYYAGTLQTITAADNSPFSILGIDLGQWGANQGIPSTSFGVTFTGNVHGGGSVTHTFSVFNVAGSPHMDSFSFTSDFTNLDSVTFEQGVYASGTAFQYNNVILSDVNNAGVPEPATFWLLPGVILMALPRLRRRG